MTPTSEQQKILNCTDKYVAINALAGTGKTTTLYLYTMNNPNEKMLYLCYNKSIAVEAKKVFPKNVDVMTFHSLAYRTVGFKYAEKLKGNLSISDIIKVLSLEKSKRTALLGQSIYDALNNYCASQDQLISSKHVNRKYLESSNTLRNKTEEEVEVILTKIANLTAKLWNHITDVNTPTAITHDTYLKLFSLNAPVLSKYDCVLIDEAQDLTPCFISFIEAQKSKLIIVGDKYQSINQWRGSCNYIENNKGKFTEFYLTESFRFNQNIADLANCALTYLEADRKIKAINKNNISGITTNVFSTTGKKHNSGINILSWKNQEKIKTKTYAIIARHNFSIYDKTLELIGNKENFFVEGNLDLKELMEVQHLNNFKITGKTSHHVYEGYNSFGEIEKLIGEGVLTDSDIIKRYNIVCRWGNKTSSNIAKLQQFCKENQFKKITPETLILTTVHKSKGKEYDCVELLDDFTCHIDMANPENRKFFLDDKGQNNIKQIEYRGQKKACVASFTWIDDKKWQEEMNIFYVALTRSKECLFLPKFYHSLLNNLVHLQKKGFNDTLNQTLFEQGVNFTPQLVSLFEREKLKEQLSNTLLEEIPERAKKVVKL